MYFHFSTLLTILRQTLSPKNFHPRHAILGFIFLGLFLGLRCVVWTARQLDRVLFPGYKRHSIKSPIFIIGNPRSGTTFLHRLMANDPQFTFLKLYQTIFPAVCLYKIFEFLSQIDSIFGCPLQRAITAISRVGFKGWENIHPTDQSKAESDEMYFVYAMLSPLITLQFPFFDRLQEALFPDHLKDTDRRKLKAYYLDCLQRHIYAQGTDKILLEKVALISGRIRTIMELFPDMRIVHMVRHPYESIPSLINMFQVPWRTLAPQALQSPQVAKELKEMIFEYYRIPHQVKRNLPEKQVLEIHYQDLVADPAGAVELIYSHFNLYMSPKYKEILIQEAEKAKAYSSRHKYSLEGLGLSKHEVFVNLEELFAAYGFEE